jgi:hypothetical protein
MAGRNSIRGRELYSDVTLRHVRVLIICDREFLRITNQS